MQKLDEKSVELMGRELPLRTVAAAGGALIWLVSMILFTGGAGVSSLLFTLGFIGVLLVVTPATRTIGLRPLLSMFLLGGFMLAVVAIIGKIWHAVLGHPMPDLFVAILEEAAMLARPAFLFWRLWRDGNWNLSATDVFLLCTISGAGMAMVETAYLMSSHTIQPVPWFPIVAVVGDRIRGEYLMSSHEIWAGIAGAAIGLALIARDKTNMIWAVGASGVVFGIFDHFVLDYRNGRNLEPIVRISAGLLFNGYLAPLLFVASLVAVIAVDVIRKTKVVDDL